MKREQAVLSGDLRNRAIPCGDCNFEEEDMDHQHADMAAQLRRHDVEIEGVKLESSNAITALNISLKFIGERLESQGKSMDGIMDKMNSLASDIGKYNNVRERVDLLEQFMDNMGTNYVPRQEFTGALNSLRAQIKVMQWIFGVGFSACAGLLAGLIVMMLGG